MFINNFEMYVDLNEKVCESLSKLKDLTYHYTTESINEVFKDYPYTLHINRDNCKFKLDQAIKKAAELAKELDKLINK